MPSPALEILRKHAILSKPVSGTDERIMTCPNCEKDDHFYFNQSKNLGLCHRCKWQCNGLGLIMAVLNLEREDALKLLDGSRDTSLSGLRETVAMLSTEAALDGSEAMYIPEVFFKTPMPGGLIEITRTTFPKVFVERKVSYKLAKSLGAKICNHGYYFNRVLFPVKTLKSETFTAVTSLSKAQYRRKKIQATKRGEQFRKSLFPKKSFISEVIFGYNIAVNNPKALFLVEGVWDVLRLKSLGLNAVAILGNYISYRQAYLISIMVARRIFIMLDGSVDVILLKRLRSRVADISLDKIVKVCVLPNGQDPEESSMAEIKKAILSAREHLL